MFSTLTVLGILFAHWIADFVCQTDEQALNKSSSNGALASHVWSYTSIMTALIGSHWIIPMMTGLISPAGLFVRLILFGVVTFASHYLTDYITSRQNAKLWKEEKRHDFFVNVGLDQVYHYIQLFLTYKLLFL